MLKTFNKKDSFLKKLSFYNHIIFIISSYFFVAISFTFTLPGFILFKTSS